MTASDLNQLLEQDLAAYNLVVQANLQDECLQVLLNRPATEPLDYSAIAKIITERIKTLELGEIHSLFLSSRVLGEYDVDWQTQFEFVSPSPVEQITVQETTEDNEQITPSVTNESESETIPEVVRSPYANYCFISNKGLLTFKILPPDETLAQLIQFFDALAESVKADILPLLEQFFATSALLPTEQFELEVQQWFEQLSQLNKAQIRKASIWFSRYCFNPEKTMTEVMAIIEPEPVIINTPQETSGEEVTKVSPTRVTQQRSTSTNTSKNQKIASTAKFHPLALPIAWLIFTVIIITITINSFDPNTIISAACKNTTGKQEYCQLAAQLVGESTFKEARKRFTEPMIPTRKTQSLDVCLTHANTNAGKSFRETVGGKIQPVSSYGEEIFPGIFVVDVKQTNFKQSGQIVRTGCVFGNTGWYAEALGAAVIPTNWPEQPFENTNFTPDSFRKTTTIYSVVLALGAGTLFNAIGLYIVALFGFGIRVTSLETIYKAAFLLGILESITSLFPPIFMIILGLPIKSLALGLIGVFIKDFHVLWSEGYPMVASGTLLIIAVSFLLKLALFSTMVSFMH